jgi:hypothetical protein
LTTMYSQELVSSQFPTVASYLGTHAGDGRGDGDRSGAKAPLIPGHDKPSNVVIRVSSCSVQVAAQPPAAASALTSSQLAGRFGQAATFRHMLEGNGDGSGVGSGDGSGDGSGNGDGDDNVDGNDVVGGGGDGEGGGGLTPH